MYSSDLLDLFATFGIAIVAMGAVWHLYWLFQDDCCHVSKSFTFGLAKPLFEFIQKQPKDSPFSFIVIACVFSFAFGQIVQDFTDYLVDNVHTTAYHTSWWPPYMQQWLLGKESEHRVRALTTEKGEPSPLFADLFAHRIYLSELLADRFDPDDQTDALRFAAGPKAFVTRLAKYGQSDEQAINVTTDSEIFAKFVNKTYYLAKNWAYSQNNYYTELEGIQHRIDFSRSCFLIASWTIYGIVTFTLLRIFLILCGRGFLLAIRRWFSSVHLPPGLLEFAKWPLSLRTFLLRAPVVLVSATLLLAVTKTGYALAEQNFNERVFGYFATHLDLADTTAISPSSVSSNAISPSAIGRLAAESWMQISTEYSTLCRTIYANAQEYVHDFLSRARPAAPLAVVLDLDETVIRNARFQGELLARGAPYSESEWRDWVEFHASEIEAVPGALKFISFLKTNGVDVVFVSNRPDDLRLATLQALRNLGIINDITLSTERVAVYLQTGPASDKQERFDAIRQKYHPIAYVGDQISDFPEQVLPTPETPVQTTADGFRHPDWPRAWFLLPNPTYGGWEMRVDWKHPSRSVRSYLALPRLREADVKLRLINK